MTEQSISLLLDSIQADTRAQSRAEIDMVVVGEYADDMKSGAIFPPLVVFYDQTTYWLAEGFHRYHAYKQAEITTISSIIKAGGLREAILQSLGSNTDHGKRRSNADKRRAVEMMLKDAEWRLLNDREIARQCGVTHPFVAGIRREVSGNDYQIEPRTATRNGTTYTINTGNIGKKAEPVAPVEVESLPLLISPVPLLTVPADKKPLTDEEIEDESGDPTYDGPSAYCKYCYTTHSDWEYTADICCDSGHGWICNRCDHCTADECMNVICEPDHDAADEEDEDDQDDEKFVRETFELPAFPLSSQLADPAYQAPPLANYPLLAPAVAAIPASSPFVSTADPCQLGYIGASPVTERDSNDWHTPAKYIELVRAVMGRIDLDPFSSVIANQTVKATQFFTIEDDAVNRAAPWATGSIKLFCNPPYGRGVIDVAVDRFLRELEGLQEAIMLVNNATETQWFQALLRECQAICFTDHRISFVSPDNKQESGNTRGQTFFYFGNNPDRFVEVFAAIGGCSRWAS